MSKLQDHPAEFGQVLTVDELAAHLRLDRKAVYDAIHRGEIPGVQRIGRCYRISRIAIASWLGGTPVASPPTRGAA